MHPQLKFSPKAARLLVREQGQGNPDRLRVLTDPNIDDICSVVRKPDRKNADRMTERGQQVSVIAQENLKLAAFLFHYRWRCTFDWEVISMHEDTLHLLTGQKRDEHKDPGILPKVNKANIKR